MIYNVYSVRDSKVGYGNPFIDVNDSSARRGFFFAYSAPSSMVKFSPGDFGLYRIGKFNSDTGKVTSVTAELICTAADFVGKDDVDA